MKVQHLAKIAHENLIWEEEKNQVFLNPDAPRWVWDLLLAVHDIDEQMPNDWVFRKVKEILSDLMTGAEPEVAPDIYIHELLEWLGPSPHWGRVDEILYDYRGEFSSLSAIIQAAQARKIEEMVTVIRDYLEELEEGLQDD